MAASESNRPPPKWRRQLNSMNAIAASQQKLRDENARLRAALERIANWPQADSRTAIAKEALAVGEEVAHG